MKCATMLLVGALLAGGCRPSTIEQMARTTALIDSQAAATYEVTAEECLEASPGWAEYDSCILKVEVLRDKVRALYAATRTLDVATRRSFPVAACAWYHAVENVHAAYPLPATLPALSSKWSRKCS